MTPEDKDRITDDIMEAFDSMAEEGADEGNIGEGVVEEPEPAPEEPAEEEPGDEPAEEEPAEEEEPEEIEVRAEEETATEEPEGPEPEEEEGEEVQQPEYAPDVQAFLDRHEGDVTAALQTATEIQKMLSRRNTEFGEMRAHITQLESELAQAQAFQVGGGMTPEQGEWIQQALESEQPGAFVQSAVAAGEFDLARAVCDAWGSDGGDAYAALRTRQMVDQAEAAAYSAQVLQQPPQEFSRDELYSVIQEQVPDFGNYWGEMTEIVTQLGREHPMVVAANSVDPNEAALGLIDIYKVARTRKARVSEARKQVEDEAKERNLAAKQQARVSSASSRTSTEEPPRQVRIAPGLTLEELDAALAAE